MVVHGWENFITALAYLFCLALLGSCLAKFCIPLFLALYVRIELTPLLVKVYIISPLEK